MENTYSLVKQKEIESCIFNIRGVQVMIGRDLAELYKVELRVINKAVKRNSERFPDAFMFQLTGQEWEFLRSQFVTLKNESILRSQNVIINDNHEKHRKLLPYVFTEQGVATFSGALRSDVSAQIQIKGKVSKSRYSYYYGYEVKKKMAYYKKRKPDSLNFFRDYRE